MPIPIEDFHRARNHAAGFGDAELQRIIANLGKLLVGGDREEYVGRLHADS
jgi:hypothetical protein